MLTRPDVTLTWRQTGSVVRSGDPDWARVGLQDSNSNLHQLSIQVRLPHPSLPHLRAAAATASIPVLLSTGRCGAAVVHVDIRVHLPVTESITVTVTVTALHW